MPSPLPKENKEKTEGARASARLLLLHLAVCAGLAGAGYGFFALGLHFPICGFYAVTGKYCLTCGATRATHELLALRVWNSLCLNPLPALLALMMLAVLGTELAGVLLRRRIRFLWLPWFYVLLLLTLGFCLARNVGLIPPPDVFY